VREKMSWEIDVCFESLPGWPADDTKDFCPSKARNPIIRTVFSGFGLSPIAASPYQK
jgi:hypothetical protein